MSPEAIPRRIFLKNVAASSGDAQVLFVVGTSVFPLNGGYNASGPLAALALRLGDELPSYIERPRRL